jgi:hypothetical protein
MALSELYKVIPSEPPPFQFPFPVKKKLNDSIQYMYKQFLYPEKKLKVGRAININKSIVLVQILKPETKKPERKTKRKEYYEAPSTAEIISDDAFLEKYKHYLDTPKIDYDPLYLNNRMGLLESVQKMMEDIPIEEDSGSCEKTSDNFQRMTHQEIIRRYINSYTPYRGLLLFHGLGSGKTCSSISLIEGLMDSKKVVIMTPASLQSNYRTQMKFCGEHLFRKNNHWVFERFKKDTDDKSSEYLKKKQAALDLLHIGSSDPIHKFIDEINGLWMVQKGEPNFDSLSARDKDEVDRQLTLLIKEKYTYINYNGIRQDTWEKKYKKNGNPFDNSTIIVDEAHNFVSRIVNKLNKGKTSISVKLYEEMMSAENCRVILLTGTPFINYPYELGVLFNLIHGYTYVLEITLNTKKSVSLSYFEDLLLKEGIVDIVEYNDTKKKLRIIKNPYGFLKQPDGKVVYSKEKQLYYSEFSDYILNLLKKKSDVFAITDVSHSKLKHLPDTQKDFDHYFLSEREKDESKLMLFQLRIVGLVSYLGDKTNLMPSIVKADDGKRIHVEKLVMSPHQVAYYAETRKMERKQETNKKKSKKKQDETEESSSYRIFSRAACNFVFPNEIERPMPGGLNEVSKIDESILDNMSEEDMLSDVDGKFDTSDVELVRKNKKGMIQYQNAIDAALVSFQEKPEEYFETGLPKLVKINHPENNNRLEKYSPKFKKMLENIITEPDCHLIYSNFRKLEGIGLFRLALLYHGYKELKIVNQRIVTYSMFPENEYIEDKKDHRYFALFTGTETVEEKEIILNIYNNRFKNLPKVTQDDLKREFSHVNLEKIGNMHGEIIKVLMITASGAEGIDLKNTRFVHIMEPYWHHVRINQVIGRARRICSHMDLPKDLQDVTVYMYISTFGDDVLKTDQYLELKSMDNSESTDMRLHKIMEEKEKLSERFLDILKRTSIDCSINHRKKCFSFPKQHPNVPPNTLVTTNDYHDAAAVRLTVKKE